MKRILAPLFLTAILGLSLQAQTLSSAEVDKAVKYLEKTRTGVLDATKGLSEAQWNFKQATNRWSVAEVTEHIAAAEEMLMTMVHEQLLKAPPRTNAADVKAVDAFVLEHIPDRSVKAQAPEPLIPVNRFHSPKESLKHFEDGRAKTIVFVKTTKDLRQHATMSPVGKELDGYEWILFVAAHSERHTKQILEVKADPNFPKK